MIDLLTEKELSAVSTCLLRELDSITVQLIEKYKPEHDWTAEYGLKTRGYEHRNS